MAGPESEPQAVSPRLSKRGARRLIQRAFVLAGRDRAVRQHLRQANLTTLWIIEGWGFAWTVVLHQGRIEFERRPAKNPDVTLAWLTAEEFFNQIENGAPGEGAFEVAGNPALQKFTEQLYQAFRTSLRELLRNPVDEDGHPLV